MSLQLRKLWRFMQIYGPRRALFKAAGRLRSGRAWWFGISPFRRRDIGVIGCGQFAFATIGYVIGTRYGNRFAVAYDPEKSALHTFSRFYGAQEAASAEAVISTPGVQIVYIASNHATHAAYAATALAAGIDVYVEKPIAVTVSKLENLLQVHRHAPGRLFAGYNRPHSAAIRELRHHSGHMTGPMTLSCTIQGHVLGSDHWYRRPQEGTRVCGNVGHWLDLMVHVRCWHQLPACWQICCSWSDDAARDDNLAIVMTSSAGDLVTITMTSRSEPFEGIAETIVLQWGSVSATIDDFRRMSLHVGPKRYQRRYWPKDVGHVAAIQQPFAQQARDFLEVERSTRLMLAIAEMVRSGTRTSSFVFDDAAA